MDLDVVLPWATLIAFVGTVIATAIKYGGDMEKNNSKHHESRSCLVAIKEDMKELKDKNDFQHREFYENKNATIELKADMKHVITSLDKMMTMLERRKEER